MGAHGRNLTLALSSARVRSVGRSLGEGPGPVLPLAPLHASLPYKINRNMVH
jgi:hypothetical protein